MSKDDNQKEPHFKAVTDTAKDVRDEAKSTVNSVKRSIRNPNIKQDAKKTTKHLSSLFIDPIDAFESIANAKRNGSLKIALFVLLFWSAISFISQVGSTQWAWNTAFKDVLSAIGSLVKPFCSIIVFSIIVYIYESKGQKNLSKTITNITFAQFPFILGTIFKMIDLISETSHYVTDPILNFATLISFIYTYFAVRSLVKGETEKDSVKTYALIQISYTGILILLGFMHLGLYLL